MCNYGHGSGIEHMNVRWDPVHVDRTWLLGINRDCIARLRIRHGTFFLSTISPPVLGLGQPSESMCDHGVFLQSPSVGSTSIFGGNRIKSGVRRRCEKMGVC